MRNRGYSPSRLFSSLVVQFTFMMAQVHCPFLLTKTRRESRPAPVEENQSFALMSGSPTSSSAIVALTASTAPSSSTLVSNLTSSITDGLLSSAASASEFADAVSAAKAAMPAYVPFVIFVVIVTIAYAVLVIVAAVKWTPINPVEESSMAQEEERLKSVLARGRAAGVAARPGQLGLSGLFVNDVRAGGDIAGSGLDLFANDNPTANAADALFAMDEHARKVLADIDSRMITRTDRGAHTARHEPVIPFTPVELEQRREAARAIVRLGEEHSELACHSGFQRRLHQARQVLATPVMDADMALQVARSRSLMPPADVVVEAMMEKRKNDNDENDLFRGEDNGGKSVGLLNSQSVGARAASVVNLSTALRLHSSPSVANRWRFSGAQFAGSAGGIRRGGGLRSPSAAATTEDIESDDGMPARGGLLSPRRGTLRPTAYGAENSTAPRSGSVVSDVVVEPLLTPSSLTRASGGTASAMRTAKLSPSSALRRVRLVDSPGGESARHDRPLTTADDLPERMSDLALPDRFSSTAPAAESLTVRDLQSLVRETVTSTPLQVASSARRRRRHTAVDEPSAFLPGGSDSAEQHDLQQRRYAYLTAPMRPVVSLASTSFQRRLPAGGEPVMNVAPVVQQQSVRWAPGATLSDVMTPYHLTDDELIRMVVDDPLRVAPRPLTPLPPVNSPSPSSPGHSVVQQPPGIRGEGGDVATGPMAAAESSASPLAATPQQMLDVEAFWPSRRGVNRRPLPPSAQSDATAASESRGGGWDVL